MATKNIEELVEITAPVDTDLVLVNDVTETGADKAKKLTVANLKTLTTTDISGKLSLSGGTMTGELVFDEYKEVFANLGSLTGSQTIDMADGQFQKITASASTLTINPPTAESGKSFLLQVVPATFTVAWNANIYWYNTTAFNSAPVLPTNKTYTIAFWCNGTTWFGQLSGEQG